MNFHLPSDPHPQRGILSCPEWSGAKFVASWKLNRVDRERGVNRNQSRGVQLIHAKRLTHHPNTRYTLLVMDSCEKSPILASLSYPVMRNHKKSKWGFAPPPRPEYNQSTILSRREEREGGFFWILRIDHLISTGGEGGGRDCRGRWRKL